MYIPSSSAAVWTAITNGFRLTDAASQDICDIIHNSAVTTIKGADATLDDLVLICNRTDTYPKISLDGGSYLRLYAHTELKVYDEALEIGGFSGAGNKYCLYLLETGTSPANKGNFGQLYTKSDNHLYFMDGDGNEYTIDKT